MKKNSPEKNKIHDEHKEHHHHEEGCCCGHGDKHEHDKEHHHTHEHGGCHCHDDFCVNFDGDTEEDDEEGFGFSKIILMLAGILLCGFAEYFYDGMLIALDINNTSVIFMIIRIIIVAAGFLMVGYNIIIKSLKGLLHGELLDENFLMTIAAIGALVVGDYLEGTAVMVLYQIGEALQDRAVDKSKKNLTKAMNLKADFATVIDKDGKTRKIIPQEVRIGDIIIVNAGEKVPVDGKVIEGSALLDMSSLTGESMPCEFAEEQTILSGSISKGDVFKMEAESEYSASTVARILNMVQNASEKKSVTENFITRFARIYTPVVVGAAVIMAFLMPILTGTYNFYEWIYRACGFLVVSCPCALVISVPLGFFSGIGAASKNGIVIKGSNYLDALSQVNTAVFDKTGTITKGDFSVTDIITSDKYEENDVLQFAAMVESHSTHPVARSIVKEFEKRNYPDVTVLDICTEISEKAGKGLVAYVNVNEDKIKDIADKYHFTKEKIRIMIGNTKLLKDNGIGVTDDLQKNMKDDTGKNTELYLAVDDEFAGKIYIEDQVKATSESAIKELKDMGVHTVMLTGDQGSTAQKVADKVKIDEYHAELLPDGKVECFEKIMNGKKIKEKTVFIGDGINDAPVLARADVGIAMGGVGSDAAIEAADVIFMTDELDKLPLVIKISKFTKKIVYENIVLSIGIKMLIIVLMAVGIGNMWLAVFGDVGVALIAIANSVRAQKIR